MCNSGITQFYLPPTHEPCLPLLPSCKASPPFGWYSLRLPTKAWLGRVDLGGWSHTEIKVPRRELNPDTVTHPSTNRVRRRVTSLICATPPSPLSQPRVWSVRNLTRPMALNKGSCCGYCDTHYSVTCTDSHNLRSAFYRTAWNADAD